MNTSIKKRSGGAGTRRRRLRALVYSLLTLGIGILAPDFGDVPRADTLSFKPQVDYDTGGANTDVQISDVDRNGKPDLVAGVVDQSGGGAASVLLGRGNGTFRRFILYPVGAQVASVAIGDVNRDGNPDVATGNYISALSVLLGAGDGSFGSPVNYATGPGPAYLAIGDVNRDGKPDLVSTSPAPMTADNSVSVLLGRQDGTFRRHVDYPTSPANLGVAIADVNRDGSPDLVTARSILLGRGDGTFEPHTDYAPGYFADAVAVGDVNRDGKPDLVATNSLGSGSLGVLVGRGDGTFETPVDYATTGLPVRLTIGDVNRDGRPDLINTYAVVDPLHPAGGVSVMLGRKNGTFRPPVNFGAIGTGSVAVQVADVNRDGKPDLIAATSFRVSVFLNDGQ